MKKIIAVIPLIFVLATLTAQAAGISIRFADSEVAVRIEQREYVANATDPAKLIRLTIWDEGNIVRHEEPLSSERDEGKVIELMEISPPTWLLPKNQWDTLTKEWAELRKIIEIKPVDFPAVHVPGPEILLMVEEKMGGRYTLRAADPTRAYRECLPVNRFAYPPPEGKAFKLGTLRGLLIPIIADGNKEYGILPVKK